MTSLYNCKHSGDRFRISKFDTDLNLEASYLCDLEACECPAGHRPTCRHRQMLPKFIARGHIGDEWFFDHDRGGWVQGWKELSSLEDQLVASAALPIQQDGPITSPFIDVPASAKLREGLKYSIKQKNDLHALRYQGGEAKIEPPLPSPPPIIRRRV